MNEEELALLNASDENPAPETEQVEQQQEAEPEFVYDPNQEYVDDNGNQVAPNLETGEWEIVAAAPATTVAEPAPAETAQTAQAPAAYKPAAPALSLPEMPDTVKEQIRELYITDPIAAMDMQFQYRAAQDRQAQAVASWQMEQRAAVAPDFYRVHGKAMEAHLATMPIEKRVTEEAQLEAAAVAVYREIQATKDPGAAFARAAALFNAQSVAPAPKPAPPAPPPRLLAPSQRATSPTVNPNRDPAPRPHVNSDAAALMRVIPGLSAAEAAKIAGRK